MNYKIREAKMSDALKIFELSSQLGYPLEKDAASLRLSFILDKSDQAVFVAESDKEIIGWVHVHIRCLIETPVFAEIGGLVTDINHRGMGIGKALMVRCEEWTKEKQVSELKARSGEKRVEAHEFYERIGYINMKKQKVFKKAF
ncbi:GNAT family N-acetyltransferase [Paenibacillus sp. GSMTC-2017]|uniref:GNAT family N-acetyltransferase n=1 Tax=Paenibacillus sp. GSMTC-2017 TaxID=2794350 RepID=UPI0018D93AC3|nr:GNAT family N-acetyltransferase [Paenibacillus sp. GSMTC-2017]MBH5320326.1 GNAT family N-acetyltransferase [Paenibacillus sp. GSMTC-2017]